MKVIAILFLVAFSSVRKVNVTSIPADHVGFKSASVSSVVACEYFHDESDSFSKAAGDLACQFTMKALFVSAVAVKDILHSYFKLQVRIAWAMESFRSAIVSWTFSNSSVCPEWLGDPINELGQIACKSLKQDESFAYFLLFFLSGCLVTFYFMNWVFGEVSFVYRSRGAGPWATKRPWKAIIEELIGLLYKIFGWLQHQAVIYTVGQVDDFTKGNDSLTTASFSDDEEILSEQMEANIPITFVERTAEDEEEDLSAYSEAAIPLDSIETTSVSASNEELPSNHDVEAMVPTDLVEATSILAATVETDDSMACESHCTSLTNEEDAPKQLQSALHPKSSFQRETGICVDGIFMPCVEATPDPVTQEDREQLSVLLQRELNKFGIYNDLGEFMPFAEPSPLVATEQDREHLKMLLNRETKKVSLIRPIAKSSLQLAASNQELESLQLAAWKRDSESSTIRSVTKSSLQLSASKQESESPPIQLTMPMSTRKSSKYGIDESIYESIYTTVLVRSKVPKEYAQWAEEMARTIESKSSLGSTGTDVAMS